MFHFFPPSFHHYQQLTEWRGGADKRGICPVTFVKTDDGESGCNAVWRKFHYRMVIKILLLIGKPEEVEHPISPNYFIVDYDLLLPSLPF